MATNHLTFTHSLSDTQIQLIDSSHDDQIRQIIQSVGAEYGAVGDGFGPSDDEVFAMSQNYEDAKGACYFIASQRLHDREVILGGCGIAPFITETPVPVSSLATQLATQLGTELVTKTQSPEHSLDSQVCELRKLFLLPEARGLGIGKALTEHCLAFAKAKGYKHCYLDTLSNMVEAIRLYHSCGFERLPKPMAGTIHNGCDVWMLKSL